jgi:hypothetical protein
MIAIKPYKGPVDVNIRSWLPFDAEVTTQHLRITPVKNDEQTVNELAQLFADPKVMELYMDGTLKTHADAAKRIKTWADRFFAGDPFSGYRIADRAGAVHGFIVVGHGDAAGESQMAGLGAPRSWGNGFGKEAATGVVHGLMPRIIQQGVLLEGQPLREILATAHFKNKASNLIMQDLGMNCGKTTNLYGGERNQYIIPAADLGMEKLFAKERAMLAASPAPAKRPSCFTRFCRLFQMLQSAVIRWTERLRQICCP